MARMRFWASVFALLCFAGIASAQSNEKTDDVLRWLFKHQADLEMVPFSEVTQARRDTVRPVDRAKDAVVLERIGMH